MGLLRHVEKGQLERMLRNVCTIALWELGITNGISDDDALASAAELEAWLTPICDHFAAPEGDQEEDLPTDHEA